MLSLDIFSAFFLADVTSCSSCADMKFAHFTYDEKQSPNLTPFLFCLTYHIFARGLHRKRNVIHKVDMSFFYDKCHLVIILCCTALYCVVLHFTAFYCIVPRSTTLYCVLLHCTALYCVVLQYTAMHSNVLQNSLNQIFDKNAKVFHMIH